MVFSNGNAAKMIFAYKVDGGLNGIHAERAELAQTFLQQFVDFFESRVFAAKMGFCSAGTAGMGLVFFDEGPSTVETFPELCVPGSHRVKKMG